MDADYLAALADLAGTLMFSVVVLLLTGLGLWANRRG
jgi:hypothetical protein